MISGKRLSFYSLTNFATRLRIIPHYISYDSFIVYFIGKLGLKKLKNDLIIFQPPLPIYTSLLKNRPVVCSYFDLYFIRECR